MSKKPRVPQQKKAISNPLMTKFLQKAGVQQPQTEADKKRYIEVHNLWKSRGAQDALVLAEQAVKDFPTNANLLNLTAVLLMQVHRQQEAIAMFERIPDLDKNVGALTNLGLASRQIREYQKAADYLAKALALDPNQPDAVLNMGLVQKDLGNEVQAIAYYERALSLPKNPSQRQVAFNLATMYQPTDLARASEYYLKALELDPSFTSALGNWAFIQNYRTPYEPERIAKEIMHYAKACAEAHKLNLSVPTAREAEKKLHIGLVTADLKDCHPVGFFIQGLLLSEAAKQFDWSAYLNGAFDDNLTREVRPVFKNWHNIEPWTDSKAIEQIRADGIDVLIDLSGYTAKNRFGIFTVQAAPLQLEWLGWFATTGLPNMNGIIADPYCVPVGEEHLYSEKVYRLPHTRLCMQPPREQVAVAPLPALSNGYITFGCFQNPSKINDEVLQTWAQIAKALPEARWLFKNGEHKPGSEVQHRFADKLSGLGFNANHLIFTGPSLRAEYFETHNQVDLILDTFPYPGGTTTAESLWMGVPTITLTQTGMIARQGEQMLCAVGLNEFVCHTREQYIEKALYWANPAQREILAQLHNGLRAQVLASPLFDNARFAQDWSDLIRQTWRDACEKRAQ